MSVSERRHPLHRLDATLERLYSSSRVCLNVFDEYVDVNVHLTVAEARQVAESLLKVVAVVEGRRSPTVPKPFGSIPRLYLGQSSCLGCRDRASADRTFIKAAINRVPALACPNSQAPQAPWLDGASGAPSSLRMSPNGRPSCPRPNDPRPQRRWICVPPSPSSRPACADSRRVAHP
jgi:hypothetical protein